MKKFFFRVDVTEKTALGHIKRCIALSEAFLELNCQVFFCTFKNNESHELLKYKNVFWTQNLINDGDDFSFFSELIKKENPHVVIFDSYDVTEEYLLSYKNNLNTKLICFDDFLKIQNADIVISNNLREPKLQFSSLPQVINGIEYVVLSKEYWDINSNPLVNDRIVFTLGGIDYHNLTEWFIKIIDDFYREKELKPKIDIVIGHYYTNLSEINFAKSKSILEIKLHENLNSLINLFSNTSLIVCGGGITIFEAIRLQKQVIAISLSKEQSMHVECLHKLNLINGLYSGGEFNSSQLPIFERNILEVCEKYLFHHMKREQSSLVIDGQGARRVASMIVNIL